MTNGHPRGLAAARLAAMTSETLPTAPACTWHIWRFGHSRRVCATPGCEAPGCEARGLGRVYQWWLKVSRPGCRKHRGSGDGEWSPIGNLSVSTARRFGESVARRLKRVAGTNSVACIQVAMSSSGSISPPAPRLRQGCNSLSLRTAFACCLLRYALAFLAPAPGLMDVVGAMTRGSWSGDAVTQFVCWGNDLMTSTHH